MTRDEIADAIKRGYRDLESLKRYIGFGTGPCQGKQCIQFVREMLSEMGCEPGPGMTARPPIVPMPLAMVAQEEEHEEPV